VRLGGELGYTDFFPIETGVRQGCIISPLIYSIYINDIARTLKQQQRGAAIDAVGEHRLCILLYADDIVLLADGVEDLRAMMVSLHHYSRQWRFEVNHSKCGLMRFNHDGSSRLPTDELDMGGVVVPWVTMYKYLGVEMHNGVPFRHYRKRALASATSAGYRVAAMGMYSGKLSVPLGVQVYQALVRPLLEYTAEVVSITPWPHAEELQLTMAKRILQCPTRTSGVAAMGELGWQSMEARYQQLRVSFWVKVQMMPSDSPVRHVYEASSISHASTDAGDFRVHAVEPEEGWDIVRPDSASAGQTLWCALLKCDLFQLGLRTGISRNYSRTSRRISGDHW
jgi:hypothetical protein